MKKIIVGLLVIMIALVWAFPVGAAGNDIVVIVQGQRVSFPDQQPFIDENGRTMVPVRFVSEALGAQVDWFQDTQKVKIEMNSKLIYLKIGEKQATVNGQVVQLDTQAILKNSRTMVPLRFVSEALGAKVGWDSGSRTVTVSFNTNGYSVPQTTDLRVNVPPQSDNPNKLDISILVTLYKPLDAQIKDLNNILASKFGTKVAQDVVSYVKQKIDSDVNLDEKYWNVNGQKIRVISTEGNDVVDIAIWQAGV